MFMSLDPAHPQHTHVVEIPVPRNTQPMKFEPYPKIKRSGGLYITITEKIDGTNAQVCIRDGEIRFGSRKRWVTPGKQTDNYGFAAWGELNRDELLRLGNGRHYGEWYGQGINSNYGMKGRGFALFNTDRDPESLPACVTTVPVLYRGPASAEVEDKTFTDLWANGSTAVPGYAWPEGIVTRHHATGVLIKRTFAGFNTPKWKLAKGEA